MENQFLFEVEVTLDNKEDRAAFFDRAEEKIQEALASAGITALVRSRGCSSFDDLDYTLQVDAAHEGN